MNTIAPAHAGIQEAAGASCGGKQESGNRVQHWWCRYYNPDVRTLETIGPIGPSVRERHLRSSRRIALAAEPPDHRAMPAISLRAQAAAPARC